MKSVKWEWVIWCSVILLITVIVTLINKIKRENQDIEKLRMHTLSSHLSALTATAVASTIESQPKRLPDYNLNLNPVNPYLS